MRSASGVPGDARRDAGSGSEPKRSPVDFTARLGHRSLPRATPATWRGHPGWSRASPASTRDPPGGRSEEHTSELQSRQYLVCRLLLEKKKEMKTDSKHLSRSKRGNLARPCSEHST